MKTITFYSYKGGVGRSLALANIATRLSELGKKVCLLDFDLEAPGLHYKFASHLSKDGIEINRGIVDYIYEFAVEGRQNDKISDFAYSFFNYGLSGSSTEKTILIPAGNVSPEYWEKLGAINWNNLLFDSSSGFEFLLSLQEKIKKEFSPDYLLIDSRTGISQMSGIALSLLAEEVVLLAAYNKENLEGSKKIIKSLSNREASILDRTPKITFVLSRVPFTEEPDDKAKEQNLIAKVEREFDKLISDVNIIHSDRELELDEQIKIGYVKDGVAPQVSKDYLRLFDKLTLGDFSDDQLDKFKSIKEAEKYFQMAVLENSENSILKKLEFIKRAIDFNPHNKEYFLFRAELYDKLQDDKNVITDCDNAIYLDTQNFRAYELKGKTLLKLKDYSGAKWAFEAILRFDRNHTSAKLGLAEIFFLENNYDKALTIFNEIIHLDNENSTAYTGRANIMLSTKNYLAALEDVYQAISLNGENAQLCAILAEINAYLNNSNEFYLNLERSLRFDKKWAEDFLRSSEIRKLYLKDKRFERLVEKYNLDLSTEQNN